MKILLRTMSFETGFLQLQSQYPRIKPQLLLLLHRLGSLAFVSLPLSSSSSSSDGTTGFNQDLHYMTATLDSPILHSLLQKPYYANYKVLFELIDHNVKLNICQDFQTSLMLERSLVSILNNFSLKQDHSTVSDLGSLFSFEGIICHSSFVINSLLLQFLNPTTSSKKKPIHQSVTTMFDDLRRFPPLPKSEFFDFESITPGLSKTYLDTVHGFERICLSSELCLGILLKNLKLSDKQVTLESSDLNLQYRSTDLLLQLYFETLFVHLIVSQELSNKSALKEFTDWKSMANVMKLQVFQNFSALFDVYGSFALYKLVLFISEISLRDLHLQRLGLKLLKHLVCHCENSSISELIRKPLVEYVELWDDGTGEYDQFYELLKLDRPTASISLVPLDTNKYLRLLSQFTEVDEQSPIVSPVSMDSNTSASSSGISPVTNQKQSSYPHLYNSANMPNTSGYNGSIPSSNSTRQSSYSGSSNNKGYRNIVSSTQSFIPTKQNKYPNLSASNSDQITNINNNQNNYNYNYNGQDAGGRNSTQRGVSISHLPNSSTTGHEQYGGNVNDNYINHLNAGNSGRTMSMNHGSYGV
ncbi:hypothetical protein WICPIJ_009959 [Wickerhamomyces pijperi]|uniref:Uncharacterized protein n=1 Tax=Wickerhamomyces pijperi TaxID=599730 RepID=A0A9P8TC05_WICPI|nr:hypothetical protein WICPIJ_009959 [Wickerhamomyces pijperi]